MNKVFYIILISLFSLIIISCAKKDDSSSSSSSSGTTTTTTTTTTLNACQTEGSTSRNVSLFSTPTLSRHTEQSGGRVLYVDKSALSQYQTDHYLLLDQYDSDSVYVGGMDAVDLSVAPPSLGSQFTLELRFKFDDGGYGGGRLIGSASYKAPSINFREHGERIRYGFGDNFIQVNKPDSINFDKWHHIATTFDGTNYKLFLDGELINNSTAFQGLTPPGPVTLIGSNLVDKLNPWIGKVDEVRIWNVARTEEQIKANMDKTLTDNETDLIAYYPMAVNNNYSMIIDNSSNANHAKINNAEIRSRFFLTIHLAPMDLMGPQVVPIQPSAVPLMKLNQETTSISAKEDTPSCSTKGP
jgi:hypothetical protein